ncbi:oxidoreductase [Paenibacillus baekrokdamisoli]|uniref:Oxidoreductase n=1 Tax=Paenibacillus baekrokdamisoli TaxID=1712516 RepID=A0A3G9J1U0_9BACL|nr:Gfo/Idh/MocA family oxidoreductase [Paenibacillus baekrokdamisoli]MBB3072142.1 putative dehydrogenase [Paenibacillus baekrokdamisoli]BBH24726.1 oxidoreductase [Paenibacillus baekrokdamisoli]
MNKVKVGIVGCGNISHIYFTNLKNYPEIDLVAAADLDLARAQQRAEEFGLAKAYTVDQLMADPEIEIVVNLTIPKAHASVCLQALEAGKHVYVEKPIVVTREEGKKVLKLAEEKGLRVASAPETFLGGGIQTCRKLIDDGAIGTPISAAGFMICGGHESWHPDPEFYYEIGGGPMFDMGPYYLTAFVTLLGPIRRVTGSAVISYPERTITSEKKKGKKITVETPTHLAGVLDFQNGAVGTLITSFDASAGTSLPNIEIHGSAGTLLVPDPNGFGGTVKLRPAGGEWEEIALTHGHTDNNRGIGVADMARAIRDGGQHRASGAMAYHVLEAMHGIHDASRDGKHYTMESTCERPEPMPALETQTK